MRPGNLGELSGDLDRAEASGFPCSVLDALHRCIHQLVGIHAPLFAVGLDAARSGLPLDAAAGIVGYRSEQLHEMVGLDLQGVTGELTTPVVDGAGELLAVGENVGVLVEPCESAILLLVELPDALVEHAKCSSEVATVAAEPVPKGRSELVSSRGE